MRAIVVILALISILSCKKEMETYPQAVKFNEMVNHLELNCLDTPITNFFKATIKGERSCYYSGYNNMKMRLDYASHFITQSPSTTSAPEDFGHVIIFGITLDLKKGNKYQNWVEFQTPVFSISTSKERYLDSLFSIPDHRIAGKNSPEGIKVKLKMYDKKQDSGGSVYSFYSETGCQDVDSYLRFKKADKILELGYTYYDIEMEIQCDLFYYENDDGDPQYGQTGKWGKIENGLLKMKVRL